MKTKGIYRPYLLQSVFTLIIIIIIIILFFFFQIMKPPWFLQEPDQEKVS